MMSYILADLSAQPVCTGFLYFAGCLKAISTDAKYKVDNSAFHV